MRTAASWNFAVFKAGATFDARSSAGWSPAFAFDDSGGRFPFSIMLMGCPVRSWGYLNGSNITDAPPPSPITPEECGLSQPLRLVPFGSTNIRISVFPWVDEGEGRRDGGGVPS